jgi:multimeric flavodoxin WrbA
LESFGKGVREAGSELETLSVSKLKIEGCRNCGACGKEGVCAIKDDMSIVYQAFEWAQSIVVSAPIFFYDVPAQGKALIDRSQAFWSRRYVLGQHREGRPGARGFLLAVGATKGADLFSPVNLSVRYFFDALAFPKSFPILAYRKIEGPENLTLEQLEEVRLAGYNFASV